MDEFYKKVVPVKELTSLVCIAELYLLNTQDDSDYLGTCYLDVKVVKEWLKERKNERSTKRKY